MSTATIARRARPGRRIPASADAYVARMKADVKVYTDWLTTYGQKGYIGEFGWPGTDDAYAFARFAEALYGALVGGPDVWVAAWLASETYPNHVLAAYRGTNTQAGQTSGPLTTRTWVGKIVEQHKGVGRGVNLGNMGENGADQVAATSTFSNAREMTGYTFGTGGTIVAAPGSDPYQGGAYVKQWNYGSSATWAYLGSRGVKQVRLPFRAERICRTFSAALDTTEVSRINTALGYAATAGIDVILDCHNFGYYYQDNGTNGVAQACGGATWTNAHFADMWSRLVTAFDSNSAVAGYDIMNEPVGAVSWISSGGPGQAAVTAIRNAGSTKCIVVETPNYCHPEDIAGVGAPWITDSSNNVRYSVHCYFDYGTGKNSSYQAPGGNSKGIYARQLIDCKTAGYTGTDVSPTVSPAGVSDALTRIDTPAGSTLGPTDDTSAAFWHNSRTMNGGTGFFSDAGYDWYFLNGVATNYNGSNAAVYVTTGLSDATVTVTMPTVGSASGGLWLRGSADGSTALVVDIGGLYTVTRTSVASTNTSIATWTSPGYASGDILQVILSGTSITVNRIRASVSTTLGTATSSFSQTGTNHGLWCYAVSSPRSTWTTFSVV